MAVQPPQLNAIDVASKHYLSQRGAHNMMYRDVWGPRSKQLSNSWTPQNLTGIINMRLAENNMLHDEIGNFIHDQFQVDGLKHLTYSTGPRGSLRLRDAAANFLEKEFGSIDAVTADDIFVMPGLTSAVDALVWSICNEGDGIIIPRPLYNGFKIDVQHRTGAVVVEADYQGLEAYSCIDDVFDAAMTRKALERALMKAQNNGIVVKAVLIANPHNPLGRCYPVDTLKEIAAFCGRNRLHFIADEIYARSVFTNPSLSQAQSFTSTLAIDLSNTITSDLHHVLYGASKDFCANGLRLGFIYSKNKGIMGAISSNSPFSWSPHILQDVWAAMLENDVWRHEFFTTNRMMMEKHYKMATDFFQNRGIDYYEMNAGVYIWVDLRPFFFPSNQHKKLNYNTLKMNSGDSEFCERQEARIIEFCANNGVMIAPGSSYRTEEYGWFRVTFTMPEAVLKEGLERIWKSLLQIQTSW